MRKRPLTAAFVARVKTPGRYGDGGHGGLGLYLRVHRMTSGRVSRSWGQRIRVGGKPTNLGLGSYPVVTLREAREKALENRRSIHWGHDPRAARVPTFEAAVEKVMAIHSPTWKNPSRIAGQWRQTLRGLRPSAHRPEARERGRDGRRARHPQAHLVKQARSGEGRTSADRHGDEVGPSRRATGRTTRRVTPSPPRYRATAMPPDITRRSRMARCRRLWSRSATRGSHAGVRLALEFMVLTATRSNEVRGATWDEFDHDVWTIPASRMKAKRAHRVPLSRRALEILEEARKRHGGGIVFRGAKGGGINASMFSGLLRHLGIEGTPHGMRSSFRDWCSETGVAREVAEAALAHVVKNRVEAAYARSDLLDRRRKVVEAWADYLASERRDPEAEPIR